MRSIRKSNTMEYDVCYTNKEIVNIVYNHLNLPTLIDFGSTGTIGYIYNAAAQKVRKTVYNGINGSTEITDYLDGFQYKNDNLLFFPHAEGYVNCNAPKLLHQINSEGMIEEVLVDDKILYLVMFIIIQIIWAIYD